MSLRRAGRTIACACASCGTHTVRAIASSFVAHKKITPEQLGFQGLFSGYFYDNTHGFGYDRDGSLVIVTPDATTFTKVPTGSACSETDIFINATKSSYSNIPSAKDFRVPLNDSLSDDETEYFLNAAKESYNDNNKNNKKK